MSKKSPVICDGIKFEGINEFSNYYNFHPSTISRRLRTGWTPEQSVGLVNRKRATNKYLEVEYQGIIYPSIKHAAIAQGLNEKNVRARILRGNYSLVEALNGELKDRVGSRSEPIIFNDIEYSSKESLAKHFNMSWRVVSKRIKRGWTMQQALGVVPEPPRFRNFEGHARNHKWKEVRYIDASNIEPVPDAEGFKLYLVSNTFNKKVYIGITITSLKVRLKQHFAASKTGRKSAFMNAIRKYGENAFKIELIRSDAKTFENLQLQEIEEIKSRDAIKNGYNTAVGGAIGTAKKITINGKAFFSRAQAAEYYDIDILKFNLRVSRLNWTPEQAAGLDSRTWTGKAIPISLNGVEYKSLSSIAKAYNVDYKMFYHRIKKKGWTADQALGLKEPPIN